MSLHPSISHDQLFQDVLESFCGDFLELTVPHLTGRLHLDRIELVREKGFTARPRGRLLIRDLVARVPTRSPPPKSLVVNVEVERRFRKTMAPRLRRYSHQRSAQHPEQMTLSIVLYLTGGEAGVKHECLKRRLWDEEDLDWFWYYAFGLEKSLAEDYVDRPQPLAPALAALMRSELWDLAEQKLRCLGAIARAEVDEERRFLLVNLVETYLTLTGRDAERYAQMVAREGHEEIRDMELTWAGRIQQKSRREGLEEGQLQGARQIALHLLKTRFGELSAATTRKVEAICDVAVLRRLSERLLGAESLADLDLD